MIVPEKPAQDFEVLVVTLSSEAPMPSRQAQEDRRRLRQSNP
jgi:hypothetical protein